MGFVDGSSISWTICKQSQLARQITTSTPHHSFLQARCSSWRTEHTHTHPVNGPFSGTTRVSRYQKGKKIWMLLSGSGIRWTICKSAPRSRQITTPALHHSVFYRPDALPVAQPTVSKHWRQQHWKQIKKQQWKLLSAKPHKTEE